MALSAFGTLLKIGDGGGPETFTTIAEVTDLGGPKFASNPIEVTSHSSPGGYREFIPGLLEAGEISFTINFIPTNATHSQSTGLLRDFKNRTKRNFQMVFPDAGNTTWSFPAYVTAYEVKAPPDGQLSADITLQIAAAPTLAG